MSDYDRHWSILNSDIRDAGNVYIGGDVNSLCQAMSKSVRMAAKWSKFMHSHVDQWPCFREGVLNPMYNYHPKDPVFVLFVLTILHQIQDLLLQRSAKIARIPFKPTGLEFSVYEGRLKSHKPSFTFHSGDWERQALPIPPESACGM
jgi:hypothetical protein